MRPKAIEIKIENRLIKEKRDIHVYHHFTRSAHIISDNSGITLPLAAGDTGDYLHISAVRGPGNLKYICLINLSSRLNVECSTEGKISLVHTYQDGIAHLLLKIPPGPPAWQVKVTRPVDFFEKPTSNYVIIVGEETGEPP